MSKQKPQKRSAGQAGIKALIASASVAATIAGWALLPANDPRYDAVAYSEPTRVAIIGTISPTATASPTTLLQASPTLRPSAIPTIAINMTDTTAEADQSTAQATTAPTEPATAIPTETPTVVPTAVQTEIPTVVPTAVKSTQAITRTHSSR